MAEVVVYSADHCPYCDRAKALLAKKGVAFEEIRVDLDPAAREVMMKKSQRRTVPQIFINDQPVGGFDDLWALEKEGTLDKLLD